MLLLHRARQQPDGVSSLFIDLYRVLSIQLRQPPPPQAAKAGDACFAPAQPGRAAPRTRTLQGPYEGPQRSARPKTITL